MHVQDANDDEMKMVNEGDENIYIILGIDHEGKQKQFGLPKSQLAKHLNRGSNIKLAQFLGIVAPGLVLADHIFQGLKRPMCVGGNMNADREKLVFSWKPAWDYWWNESYRFDSKRLEFRESPDGKVFVVVVSRNEAKETYPSVDYWIERWFWVRRSTTLQRAPTEWETRFEKKLK